MARLREQVAAARAEERSAADELAQVEAVVGAERDAVAALEAQVAASAAALRSLEGEREAVNPRLVDALTGIARAEDRSAAAEQRRAEIARRLRSADEAIEVQQGEASRADAEQRRLEEGLNNLLGERDRLMGALRDAIDEPRTRRRAREGTRRAGARGACASREARGASRVAARGARARRGHRRRHAASPRGVRVDALRSRTARAGARRARSRRRCRERGRGGARRSARKALVATGLEGALSAVDRLRSTDAGRAVLVIERPDEPLRTRFRAARRAAARARAGPLGLRRRGARTARRREPGGRSRRGGEGLRRRPARRRPS